MTSTTLRKKMNWGWLVIRGSSEVQSITVMAGSVQMLERELKVLHLMAAAERFCKPLAQLGH